MKIDFSQPILSIEATPIMVGGPRTLGAAVVEALQGQLAGENPTGEQKDKRLELALRVRYGKDPDFAVEELAMMHAAVTGWYTPLIAGQARAMLDGHPNPIAVASSAQRQESATAN